MGAPAPDAIRGPTPSPTGSYFAGRSLVALLATLATVGFAALVHVVLLPVFLESVLARIVNLVRVLHDPTLIFQSRTPFDVTAPFHEQVLQLAGSYLSWPPIAAFVALTGLLAILAHVRGWS